MTATQKKTRPGGLFGLCERMVKSGTQRSDLQPLYDLLPKDKHGNWTNQDLPVPVALAKLQEIVEEDEAKIAAGDILDISRRIMPLTFEKAKAIAKRGEWTLPAAYKPVLAGAFPDVEYDPDEDEEDEDDAAKTPVKKVKKQPKTKPKPQPVMTAAPEPVSAA